VSARAVALLVVLASALAAAGCAEGDAGASAAGDSPRVAAASALRDAFTDVSAASHGMDSCDSRSCLRGVGRDLRAAADAGVALLERVDTRPLPACYADAIEQATRAMTAYRRAGIAFQGVDAAAAQAAISRASRFEVGVTRSIAACST
jgi:hypothetical protein